VKEYTWKSLHDLKEAGQSYDDPLSRMIRRERDWRMIVDIDWVGEFVVSDPEEMETRVHSCYRKESRRIFECA